MFEKNSQLPVNILTAENITHFRANGADRLISSYMKQGCRPFINNVDTKIHLLQIHHQYVIPFTVNEKEYEASYVCSPYNAFVSYGRDALLSRYPSMIKKTLKIMINCLASPLKLMSINRCVQVNNRLWSTNLYPQINVPIAQIRQTLTQAYPTHALAFRSLNQTLNHTLIHELKSAGFMLLPSRPICMIDYRTPMPLSKKSSKNDRRHLRNTRYQLIEKIDIEYASELHELYQKMFIKQHSQHNPQFTTLFFETCINQNAIEIQALKDPETGRLVAMLGLYIEGSVLTVPFSGYDTLLDKKQQLYPILNAIIAQVCSERRLICHASSGAMDFKCARGGIEEMEFTAIDVNHLPWFKQIGWKGLSQLSRLFFKEQKR
ncbi:hypothetical protein [Shewanella surugensis]|uniref:GNAT family N-acetyltransferase n=1 Tax=Shewanella surugensis TaxID=212020 RepID=A0ABT0L785_9GAMM|nr:hypothetical protein [Shewanella surugensis]MCL1123429.1 hypothetical protein [Shewanella surugensis]